MANVSTFELGTFWTHLERERTHVIDTQKRNYSQALRELKSSVDKNNEEGNNGKKKNEEATYGNKKEIATNLREVEKFITPKAPQLVRKGLSDLRVYLGKRLTITMVEDRR